MSIVCQHGMTTHEIKKTVFWWEKLKENRFLRTDDVQRIDIYVLEWYIKPHSGWRHDSVIYSRSERPADSVHLHARSVPANLGRRVLRAYGPTHAQSVWADARSERMGQPHVQSVWAEGHVSNALANGFSY